ncbi:hypothetical protein EVAR_96518_1 [Eumeta japonica]|uniref:Uncharacterized protein n=1 Tax=Eumeta variegata TaxID=151549 RepID=A0A4C1WDN5_EUMVA|nr:hypothetical protein EVAR_96518_1 [Eumeta japonica]
MFDIFNIRHKAEPGPHSGHLVAFKLQYIGFDSNLEQSMSYQVECEAARFAPRSVVYKPSVPVPVIIPTDDHRQQSPSRAETRRRCVLKTTPTPFRVERNEASKEMRHHV